MYASWGLFLVGICYVAVLMVGIAAEGLSEPIADPTLAVMEVLTLLSAILIVVVMGAIYESAGAAQRTVGVVALAFAVLMAGLTSAVHFVALTSGRQTGFTVLQWPSTLYAVELLAWDVFLGLSLLFAGFAFRDRPHGVAVRRLLLLAGTLALLGTAGPITGDMALQRIGILGYGGVLPVAALLLAKYFQSLEPA